MSEKSCFRISLAKMSAFVIFLVSRKLLQMLGSSRNYIQDVGEREKEREKDGKKDMLH